MRWRTGDVRLKPGIFRQVLIAVASLVVLSPGASADYADGERAFQSGDVVQAITLWRQSGWLEDDLLSQSRLGGLYSAGFTAEATGAASPVTVDVDPIEAYVWYSLAATNPTGLGLTLESFMTTRDTVAQARIGRGELFIPMLQQERIEAQKRFVYILASRGAEGIFRLGEIYDDRRGSETSSDAQVMREYSQFSNLFSGSVSTSAATAETTGTPTPTFADPGSADEGAVATNSAEALVYYHLAAQKSHPIAQRLEASLREELADQGVTGQRIIEAADRIIEKWKPPLDYYPPPHSDEWVTLDNRVRALARIGELAAKHVQNALRALGHYTGPIDNDIGPETRAGIRRYQETIRAERTGELSAEQTVRLIQTAAATKNAYSQTALGTMYYLGIGEPQNYVRARYWFELAAEQNEPQALNNLAVIYRYGRGVEVNMGLSEAYARRAREAGYP